MHGVGGDEHPGEGQRLKQWAQGGDLVGFFRDGDLIEQALGVVGGRAHQVHGPAVLLARALDGFTVDRDRRVFFRVVRGQPLAQHGVELNFIESLESATEGRFAGHRQHAGRRVRAGSADGGVGAG